MKIAVIFQGIFPSNNGMGGGQRRVRDLTKGLSLYAEKTYMLVPSWHNTKTLNHDGGYFEVKILGNGALKRVPLFHRIQFVKEIYEFIKDEGISTVLFYNTFADTVSLMKKLKRANVFVLNELCDEPSTKFSGLKNYLLEYSAKHLAINAQLNIAISAYLQNKMLSVAPAVPCLNIPILTDSEVFYYDKKAAEKVRSKFSISDSAIVIGYAGGTWKDEGLHFLMTVFQKLSIKHKNLKLIIAGNLFNGGPHADNLLEIKKELDIEENCITPGLVSTEEVRGILSASNILALPQVQSEFNVAGLPTKLAEYSSIGKPIISSNVGDIINYFTHNVDIVLCEPKNEKEYYLNFEELITNASKRDELGKNAKITNSKYFNYKNAGRFIVDEIAAVKK
jgi:glycosyltransferase involved in cell wall biosynthesis